VAGKTRAARRAAGPQWTPEQVVELAVAHDLAELEIESMGLRVRVVRGHAPVTMAAPVPAGPAALSQAEAVAPAVDMVPGAITIEAPMVGTFYRATNPEATPFVSEGDTVKEGQTLCIIEAMKLMNEIESDVAGEIVKVFPQNGQPVEYGEKLFAIKTA